MQNSGTRGRPVFEVLNGREPDRMRSIDRRGLVESERATGSMTPLKASPRMLKPVGIPAIHGGGTDVADLAF